MFYGEEAKCIKTKGSKPWVAELRKSGGRKHSPPLTGLGMTGGDWWEESTTERTETKESGYW